jgi:hypothetical protein
MGRHQQGPRGVRRAAGRDRRGGVHHTSDEMMSVAEDLTATPEPTGTELHILRELKKASE